MYLGDIEVLLRTFTFGWDASGSASAIVITPVRSPPSDGQSYNTEARCVGGMAGPSCPLGSRCYYRQLLGGACQFALCCKMRMTSGNDSKLRDFNHASNFLQSLFPVTKAGY